MLKVKGSLQLVIIVLFWIVFPGFHQLKAANINDGRLVAHWKMDDGSGNIITDSEENGLDASLRNTGESVWIPGVFGDAIFLNGSNQDAVIESAGALGTLSSITITAYLKISSDVGWAWIATHGDNYGFYITDEGKVRFYFYDGSDWPGVNGNANVGDNQWHHVAATFNQSSGMISIYIDGNLDKSEQVSGSISYNIGSQFTIGSMMGGRFLKGSIDDLRIYDEALSQEEIIQIMNNDDTHSPPKITNGQPSGYLPLGTTGTTLSIETNVGAICKYDDVPNLTFDEMTYAFSTETGLLHTDSINGLSDFNTYNYYCKCKDTAGIENHVDYQISFKIDTVLPVGSSNIPIVVIETEGGAPIVDEPKVKALLKIIDNGPGEINHVSDSGNDYTGNSGIEIRGHFSAELPQRPYGFETRTASGENNNVSLLGMPKENDWILLANYNDKAFVRNTMAFDIFRRMGHYAPRTAFCEVYVNGNYGGIYVLTEKIKRDKNRLNIDKLKDNENSGDDVTGGYIIKNDYVESGNHWKSNYPPFIGPAYSVYFIYYYPKAKDITTAQKEYIKSYIDTFESVLHGDDFKDPETGYIAYMDVNSFIDYFLISELSRNVDGYKKSRFFYKDKASKDNRLHSGPAWDFDWAWKNIYDCEVFSRTDGSGWGYQASENCNQDVHPPVYIARLLQDTAFQNKLKRRYTAFRETFLSEEYLFHFIDSSANYLNNAQQRHYTKWDILGKNVGAPEVEQAPDTFEGEIQKLKDWITIRLNWLDANMPGELHPSTIDIPEEKPVYRIFPNPASDRLYVETNEPINSLSLYNTFGTIILHKTSSGRYSQELNVQSIKPGIYVLKIISSSGNTKTLKVIIR